MSFDDIGRGQHGLITWDQLLGTGLSADVAHGWVQSGRLERIAPSVYRCAGAPDTWHQRVMRAALDSGGWASHRTAAALRDLDGHRGQVIEVVVPRWQRSSAHTGYVVHETKDLRGVDLDVVRGIPCTSLARTLVDLPAVEHWIRAEQALDHACRMDAANLALVRQRFLEVARRGRNGTRAMRRLLEERTPGFVPPGSSFEARALRLMREHDLPEPTRQLKVVEGDFVAYLDFAWPAVMHYLECDSLAFHFGRQAHQWERTRRRRLKVIGWSGIEWTYADVAQRGDEVARELKQLLVLASTNRPEAD